MAADLHSEALRPCRHYLCRCHHHHWPRRLELHLKQQRQRQRRPLHQHQHQHQRQHHQHQHHRQPRLFRGRGVKTGRENWIPGDESGKAGRASGTQQDSPTWQPRTGSLLHPPQSETTTVMEVLPSSSLQSLQLLIKYYTNHPDSRLLAPLVRKPTMPHINTKHSWLPGTIPGLLLTTWRRA